MENIKEIGGIPDYYITAEGKLYSTKISPRYNPKGELRPVRPRKHPSGYLYYGMFVGKGIKKRRIWKRAHRLVWEVFNGKIPKRFELDHLNGDKHDNRIENLDLVTRSENMLRMFERKNKGL